LHISKQEQLSRFRERLDDPAKQWKISESDYKEREFWDDYMAAYEDALSRCSTHDAPWFVIPSDHKWFRNLALARIVEDGPAAAADHERGRRRARVGDRGPLRAAISEGRGRKRWTASVR